MAASIRDMPVHWATLDERRHVWEARINHLRTFSAAPATITAMCLAERILATFPKGHDLVERAMLIDEYNMAWKQHLEQGKD
jgi:hypothetical protein